MFYIFSCFETNFFIDVLSNFGIAFMSQTTLVVESAHRLSHLLSNLLISTNQFLGMSQLICSFAISSFTELQNCGLFLGFPLPELPDCSAVLFCAFSELQNCALFCGCPLSELQNSGAILFLAFSDLQNCAILLAAPSPNCRAMLSLGRSTPAAGLGPPNHVFGAWL